MERIEVRSSNIKSIGYDEANKILEIEFVKGKVYRYANVPMDTYESLMRCDSAGVYFASFIKGKYEYEKERA